MRRKLFISENPLLRQLLGSTSTSLKSIGSNAATYRYCSSLYSSLHDSIERNQKVIDELKQSSKYVSLIKTLKMKEDYLSSVPDIWTNDSKNASQLLQEISALKSTIEKYNSLNDAVKNAHELYELGSIENDEHCYIECKSILSQLDDQIRLKSIEDAMNDVYDDSDCYVQIIAGAGGDDACDFTGMLYRMYSKWSTSIMNMAVEVVDENKESNRGYRTITIRIVGSYAYGYMKAEAGVHRLVRLSPFDPSQKRHTSLAQVLVSPDLDSNNTTSISNENAILMNDIRIDTYKSSGAGGQHVNTTDSAVRIVHIPTNTVVTCQNERSQHQNKATALSILRSKLLQLDIEKKTQLIKSVTVGATDVTWGNQIRSIVLWPYTIAKDHRTGWETSMTNQYLAGDNHLTEAMLSYLKKK